MTISDSSGDLPDRGWFERIIMRIIWILGWISGRFWDAMRFLGRVFGRIWGALRSVGGKIKRVFVRIFSRNTPPSRVSSSKVLGWDIHLNPITWHLFFRPAVSLIAGFLTALIVKLIFLSVVWIMSLLGRPVSDPISLEILSIIMGVITLVVVLRETDKDGNVVSEKVPGTDYGAIVTILGMPTFFIRKSGDYSGWLGKRIGLGRSDKPFVGITSPGAEEWLKDGFVPLGDITFQVWDSPDADTKERRAKIVRPAKNRAPITGSLTLVGDFPKPRLWLKANDPALDLGDRARQEYQELIETLVDTDVSAVQPMLASYLAGKAVFTAFLTKMTAGVRDHKQGAMIRDRSGLVMYRVVEDNELPAAALAEFRQNLTDNADPDMLKAITFGSDFAITTLKVSGPLHEVAAERGLRLKRVTFGDIILSPKVSDAAEQASAENDERRSRLASAQTNQDARKLLRPTAEELANPDIYELTTILEAAADDKTGNIRVVYVPGGNSFARAAAVHGASQPQKGN